MEHQFTVVVDKTGDRAEADTPEAAITAARTMGHDARGANYYSGLRSSDTVSFYRGIPEDGGELVRRPRWSEVRTLP